MFSTDWIIFVEVKRGCRCMDADDASGGEGTPGGQPCIASRVDVMAKNTAEKRPTRCLAVHVLTRGDLPGVWKLSAVRSRRPTRYLEAQRVDDRQPDQGSSRSMR